MSQMKVRCQYCGAKNMDEKAQRCRICSGVLPDADQRRTKTTEGATFSSLVEGEVLSWRRYIEGAETA